MQDDDLFPNRSVIALGPGATLLGGFARERADALLAGVEEVAATAPFRHLETPGGRTMSVAMTNCGPLGWMSDRGGYRYVGRDPATGRRWPRMPQAFREVAVAAAGVAGFPGFDPDACLVNRYVPGARLTLHQDVDEGDMRAPIVSVSLGLPARFLWGGGERRDRVRRLALRHGDVAVWGGPSRRNFHGVDPLADGDHPHTGALRFNLTFRKAR